MSFGLSTAKWGGAQGVKPASDCVHCTADQRMARGPHREDDTPVKPHKINTAASQNAQITLPHRIALHLSGMWTNKRWTQTLACKE